MLRLDIFNLVITVINLIVLYLLMKKFLIGPVTEVIAKRKALIEDQLANAKRNEKEALEMKSKYEATLKTADVKADEMLQTARVNAGVEYERIVSEAESKSGRIIRDAEKTIRIEREKTLREMQSEIAGLAMTVAAKVAVSSSNDEMNKSLYDDFLREAGDSYDTDRN